MRRNVILLTAGLLVMGMGLSVFGQAETKPRARERVRQSGSAEQPQAAKEGQQVREKLDARREGGAQKEQIREIEQQITQLRAEHEQLVTELKAIHDLAVKEKATEIAKRIEKLVGSERQKFQDKLRALEQRHQRLQKALAERLGQAEQGAPAGRKAPEFSVKSFDGRTVTLAGQKGKIVVLEWFNMECPFVQYHYDNVKTMIDLAKKYKDKNVVWLAVNSTSHTTVDANKQFAAKYSLPYPILDDRSGAVGKAYGAKTTPHVFIIDTNGSIAYDGAIDNAPLGKPTGDAVNYVDKALAGLTLGKAVSTAKTDPYGCTVKYAQ